jgi:hypothetical protein
VKTHFVLVMLACVGLLCGASAAAKTASAKRALIQNPTAGKRPPVRLPGRAGAAAPPLSNVRHRSPNPAVIAGSAELSKRSIGAIDGKQVHRRP